MKSFLPLLLAAVGCATAAGAAEWPTPEAVEAATKSKYDEFGNHFLANCTGFDCLHDYVNHDDGMFHWEDLNVTISGKSLNPLSKVTWTGEFCLFISSFSPSFCFPKYSFRSRVLLLIHCA